MALKLKDTNTMTYQSKDVCWENEEEAHDQVNDEATNEMKKKRRPADLCVECPVCGGPAPDHLHFGGRSCYSCRAFFRRTSPRPITSFRCRSGLNNCIITSGSKSCIPCRLTKCLQIGMDPALVRGKKSKSDSDNDEPTNHYNEEYNRGLTPLPSLTPIVKCNSPRKSEESILKFRASVLQYQGMCLQYQASLLEKQAMNMEDTQQDYYTDKTKVMEQEQKYFNAVSSLTPTTEYIKTDPKVEPKYVADYESKYCPPVADYRRNESQIMNNRYMDYDFNKYPANKKLRMNYSDFEDQRVSSSVYENRGYNGYNERDRSPIRETPELFSRTSAYYQQHQDTYHREQDWGESSGPIDLSVKKKSSSPQLHTQAHNMPRIFFRMDQNRI